jgi:hypothetical protein
MDTEAVRGQKEMMGCTVSDVMDRISRRPAAIMALILDLADS